MQPQPPHLQYNLTSILNDPKSRSRFVIKPPPIPTLPLNISDITIDSFKDYLQAAEKISGEPKSRQMTQKEKLASEIPSLFFSRMVLSNPQTFQAVFPESFTSTGLTDGSALQNQLSFYLDLIEAHLNINVDKASPVIFKALNTYHELSNEIQEGNQKIQILRDILERAQNDLTSSYLYILKSEQKYRNLIQVLEKLSEMLIVKKTIPAIILLLEVQDFPGALDVASALDRTLATEMNGMVCFRKMKTESKKLKEKAVEGIISLFLEYTAYRPTLTQQKDVQRKTELTVLINELVRLGHLSATMEQFREDSQQNIRSFIRQKICSYNEGKTPEEILQQMPAAAFLSLMAFLESELVARCQWIKDIQQLIHAALDGECTDSRGRSDFTQQKSNNEKQNLISNVAQVLHSSCELCHVQCARILKIRRNQHKLFSIQDFESLIGILQNLISKIEQISGKQAYGLKPTLLHQCKTFLEIFHANKITSAIQVLEHENWTPLEGIVPEFRTIIQVLLDASVPLENGNPAPQPTRVKTVPEKQLNGVLPPLEDQPEQSSTPPQSALATNTQLPPAEPPNSQSSEKTPPEDPHPSLKPEKELALENDAFIIWGQRQYAVVASSLLFCKILYDYLLLIAKLPIITADIIHRIIELLHLYNTKTYALVLRQGAKNLGHIAKINAKHLAVAHHCLSFKLQLIPSLKTRLLHLVNANNRKSESSDAFVDEFDSVRDNYSEHIQEILAKFPTMMKERAFQCFANFWDDFAEKRSSKIYDTLARATALLSKAIGDYIPPEDINSIYSAYKSVIKEALAAQRPTSQADKIRLCNEILAFRNYLEKNVKATTPFDDELFRFAQSQPVEDSLFDLY